MVQWEMEYIKKEEAYTNNTGTIYLDLPKGEQIGMIVLELLAGSITVVDTTASVLDIATKIDILLNGSKLAYGCTPEVGSFMYFLATGKLPPHELSDRGNKRMILPILFGRHWRDEEYLLNTGDYKSAQIQIPYILDTSDHNSGSLKCTCWYERPREPLSPAGFIRQRIIQTETRAATAGEFSHDLPVNYPVLDIGFRDNDVDVFMRNDLTDIKLNINSGKEILFDGRIEDLLILNEMLFGRLHGYPQWARVKNDATIRTHMGRTFRDGIKICEVDARADHLSFDSIVGAQAIANMYDFDMAVQVNLGDWLLQFGGLCPHECVSLIHTPIDNPYPLNEKEQGKITYTQGEYIQIIETFVREIVTGILS